MHDQLRMMIAAGCLIGGIGIHFSDSINVALGVVIWLILAGTIGYMLPYGWTVLAAPVPWLIGVGGGVLIGQHEGLGEVWALPLAMSVAAGAVGIVFGTAARRGSRQDVD